MIYVRLAGGLGNQIFQLCGALAVRRSENERIVLGTQSLARYDSVRKLQLRNFFTLPPSIADDATSFSTAAVLDRMRVGRWLPWVGVSDRNFLLRQREARAKQGEEGLRWLDGYFQTGWDLSLFERARQFLESNLVVQEADVAAHAAVHIRGGDFLLTSHSHVASAEYYGRAIRLLAERTSLRTVEVVTDDPAYANQIINQIRPSLGHTQFIIPAHSPGMAHDFDKLRRAPARVVGNSTFSWWAAALDARHSLTISPAEWLPGVKKQTILPWEVVLPSTADRGES